MTIDSEQLYIMKNKFPFTYIIYTCISNSTTHVLTISQKPNFRHYLEVIYIFSNKLLRILYFSNIVEQLTIL